MPIYEYECMNCGKHFEHMQKITEAPLSLCPFCSGKVKKLVSNCSFQLKGSGWYVTDYARKDGDKGKKKENNKESSPDKKTDTSTSKEAVSESAVNQ